MVFYFRAESDEAAPQAVLLVDSRLRGNDNVRFLGNVCILGSVCFRGSVFFDDVSFAQEQIDDGLL